MARADWEGLGDDSPAIRAERLRVLLMLQSAEPLDVFQPDIEADLEGFETGWEQGVLLTVNDDDQALAWECLQIERDLRAAEWNALGLLDLARNGPEVKLPAAVAGDDAPPAPNLAPMTSAVLVPRAQLAAAAIFALGWNLAAPEGK